MSKRFQKWWDLGQGRCKMWKERCGPGKACTMQHRWTHTRRDTVSGLYSWEPRGGELAGTFKGWRDGKVLVASVKGKVRAFWTMCHVLPVMCRSCRWPIPRSAPISNSLCQKGPWPYSSSLHLNSTQLRKEMWVQILVKNSLTLSMLANPAASQFPQQKSAPHCVQRGWNQKIRIKSFHSYLHKCP